MKLSIIIPAFNEEKTIKKIVESVMSVSVENVEKEIIVVNDASVDATQEVLHELEDKYRKNKPKDPFRVFHHKENLGKGAAVRTGIHAATGDYILIQDADLEYSPTDIPRLLKPIQSGNATVVYGTRLKRLPNFSRDERTVRFFIHYMGNRFLSLITSIFYGQWISDMETGYKLFPKKVVDNMRLNSTSFEFEPEITAKFLKGRHAITEVPISTNPRGYDEGKKLNMFRDGPVALWALIKYRFVN